MKKSENPATPKSKKESQPAPAALAAPHLILVLYAEELAAWQASPGKPPKTLPIKGQPRLAVRNTTSLEGALADIAERLRGDGIDVTCTHWIADADGRKNVVKVVSSANWQLLAWEWLSDRFSLGDTSPWDTLETVTTQVLPWLITADDAAQRHYLRQARKNEHLSETELLVVERAALAQENDRLRAQNSALQQVDAEWLVSFLPALFARIFTVLSPSDIPLLCGRMKQLELPNPFPEPSEEALRTMQKRFRALPKEQQKQIVDFVSELPQRQKLQPRPEMRELVHDLEGL
jgi:hypothetical protein